jgi:exodeoxyribonuclease-1
MAKPTFYWHDYETWGVNPRVDRPAQFAGIRTDMDLNIISEPLMIYARPTPDFLPSPEAVLITGITPQRAAREGLIEAEFFRRIHAEYTQGNTCVVGYNSLRFDEEVTRFGFYRNFYDPYAYSWQNGNSRWDVLDLMRLTRALRPEGIEWPSREDGTTSFKLTDLTAANGIEQVGAHDALVDVRATIAVAKLVKDKQPRLFDFYFDLRNKQRAAAMLNSNQPGIVLHVSGMFPAEQGCLAPVVPLLVNPNNSNEVICYNLRIDPTQFLALDADRIREKLYTRSVDLEYGEDRIPLKGVHLNKSPALAPMNTLTDQMSQQWEIDRGLIDSHLRMLQADRGLIPRLQEVYAQPREFESSDVDSALYDGFISNDDRAQCNRLLAVKPDELANWSAGDFSDQRLGRLLLRYRARNYPETLSPDELDRWARFCRARLVDGEYGAGLTLEGFQQQLITLAQQHQGEREIRLLDRLSSWVQEMVGQ